MVHRTLVLLLCFSMLGCQRSASQVAKDSAVSRKSPQDARNESQPMRLRVDDRSPEDWSPLVNDHLRRFGELIQRQPSADLSRIPADDYVGSGFRPETTRIHNDGEFVVSRGLLDGQSSSAEKTATKGLETVADPRFHGVAGFQTACRDWVRPFALGSVHFSHHVVQVQTEGTKLTTQVQIELSGRTAHGLVEHDALWQIEWSRTGDQQLAIHGVAVMRFEEVLRKSQGPLFSDRTAAVCAEAESFREQMRHSHSYWRDHVERHHIIDKSAHHGIAVGDVNGDGMDDVYICQPGGLPNRLLVHQADGTAHDISATSGTDILDNTRSALLIDFDNNATQDLVLATASGVMFFRNDGAGQFNLANHILSVKDAYSMVAADYDNDGDLDIYACRYYPDDADAFALPVPTPYFDARNGGHNFLIRNDGNWRTSDGTAATGLNLNNDRFSYAAVWVDFDRDEDQDLYIANDFGRNNLYENRLFPDGVSEFVDVAESVGMRDGAFGMSASCGDFDRDGDEDIYVGNMFSSAGNRIARLPSFRPDISAEMRNDYLHLASGNTLFANRNGQRFEDVSAAARVTQGRWSWGSVFIDMNNDGWQDLIVANGYITGSKPSGDL